ncbi:hypothetical protein CKO15_03010 [Halorhodospira abdelmalekii]|uniref:hypothetical protein n=1 Tax=Halorhodospira abdelmalekii TaxID=421629 RepID=UPI001905C5EA|nr:hypothetical protein [Halorhodospira abdelmalekii]MBK1734267.1 hypothetical protein [Halorhodospira abdelmalekii]
MRYLVTVTATVLVLWAGTIGALNFIERLGENVGYGIERMVLGDAEERAQIETLDDWLAARTERLDKAATHLGWVRPIVWFAPPGFRAETTELFAEAQALQAATAAWVGEIQRLHEEYDAFAELVGEPVLIEGKGLPSREALFSGGTLALAGEARRIVELVQAHQALKARVAVLTERGAALQERAALERAYLSPLHEVPERAKQSKQ